MTHRLFVLLFLLITQTALSRESFSSPQDTLQGKVVGIADGDTFTMLLDNKTTIKIRLASIDCPERSDHIFGNREKVVVDSKDRYGRSLGWVYYNGKNINKELLKAGLAWHFRRYSKDKELQTLEDQARAEKIGLWKDKNPIPPWDCGRSLRGFFI